MLVFLNSFQFNRNIFPSTTAGQVMTDHVYRKFRNDTDAIRELLQKDATFREICADYEEICTWLAYHCRSEGPPSEECDRARELMRGLEDDINKVLREAEFYPP